MSTLSSREPYSYSVLWGLAASVFLHAGLLTVLLRTPPKGLPSLPPIMVSFSPPADLLPALKKPESRQIVSPPDLPENTSAPVEQAFLSDANRIAQRQQIKRGDGTESSPGLPGAISKPISKPHAIQNPETQGRGRPPTSGGQKIQTLSLDAETVARRFALNSGDAGAGNPAKDSDLLHAASSPAAQPFSRPYGSGARFFTRAGNADFLPQLPDGDITLLNTKADQFAVFVRRVATQVFGELRASGWDRLRPQDILSIKGESTVLAVLSLDGKLLQVFLQQSSGNRRFDEVLVSSVRAGARDPNPPEKAAAQDGKIHFIFKSRSWVQAVTDPRTSFPIERRWLWLATGLE